MPEEINAKRRKDHETFYCPNGHPQSYRGETERSGRFGVTLTFGVDAASFFKLQRALQPLLLNELLARVKKGVCPCCKRSFANLRRHMAVKHPGAGE